MTARSVKTGLVRIPAVVAWPVSERSTLCQYAACPNKHSHLRRTFPMEARWTLRVYRVYNRVRVTQVYVLGRLAALSIYPSLEPPSTKLLAFLSVDPTEDAYILPSHYYKSGRFS
jgi:hypothetical protein